MSPNDFGSFQLVESCQKTNINDFLKSARISFKQWLLSSKFEVQGVQINFQETKTGFGGHRLWFVCPLCHRMVGTIYQGSQGVACRHCLNLRYGISRYKGMVEDSWPTP